MTEAAYIQPLDWPEYGIPDADFDLVEAASRLADAWMGRPEGLLWGADATGRPARMAALSPAKRYFLPSDLAPGPSASISLPGVRFGPADVGRSVVIDRSKKNSSEACVVSAASDGAIVLESVALPHTSGATVEFGLALSQRSDARRPIRLSRTPVASLLSAYAAGRPLDASLIDLDDSAGRLAFASSPPCGEVRIEYLAGWDYASLPDAIKRATAMIVRSMLDSEVPAGFKLAKAGDATLERFADTPIDSRVAALLNPYRLLRLA